MAARKQFLTSGPVDADLKALLEKAKTTRITEAQLKEQRVSFAFGNAPDSDLITKETVRFSADHVLIET
jgi:hypothetical protein